MVDLGEPEPAPVIVPLSADEEVELKDCLYELRRVISSISELEKYRKEQLYPAAIPLLERAASRSLLDPATGKTVIATVRNDKTKHVDYARLVELVGSEVADSVCKPRVVDCTDDGLFEKAVNEGRIPLEIAAEVMSLKPKATFIGWASPDR